VSYYSELLEDLSEGFEPRFGDCRDQEGDGFLNCACIEGVAKVGGPLAGLVYTMESHMLPLEGVGIRRGKLKRRMQQEMS
jgi:hypothetical protein